MVFSVSEILAHRVPRLKDVLSDLEFWKYPWDNTQSLEWWQMLLAMAVLVSVYMFQDDWSHGLVCYLTQPKELPMKSSYKHVRKWQDWACISANSLLTYPFTWHMIKAGITWEWLPLDMQKATIFNVFLPIPLYLVLTDLPYYFWHRFLHSKWVYQWVHKHHHLQITPTRGMLDAINTHPIEFVGGSYCQLLALWMMPVDFHVAGIGIAMWFTSLLSSLNHTRHDVRMPWLLWEARDHDIHHRYPDYNFGQYVTVWDYFFGSTRRWAPQKERLNPERWGKVRNVSDRAPKRTVVIGANGLVGKRLVSILVERGAEKVVAVDLHDSFQGTLVEGKVSYEKANICSLDRLVKIVKDAKPDAVIHTAALVGPFHKKELYEAVNYRGTLNVIRACTEAGVTKLVMTGSPSSFFDGTDKYDIAEDECEKGASFPHLTEYSRTKEMGENACLESDGKSGLHTCVISPHQVYGDEDRLFLPEFLKKAQQGLLRVMGDGENMGSFTHTDNLSHGLILGANSLEDGSPTCGQRYFISDGKPRKMWDELDRAVQYAGFKSIKEKFHVPERLLYAIAYASASFGKLAGKIMKITPFSITMMLIHRTVNIDKISRHMGYKPIVDFNDGWKKAAIAAGDRITK